MTALYVAAQAGKVHVMQLLLENKAEVDKAAADGSKTDVRTPLCRAAGNNHTHQLGGTRQLPSTRYKNSALQRPARASVHGLAAPSPGAAADDH